MSSRQLQNRILGPGSQAAFTALAIVLVLGVVASQAALAQTFTVLHNFTGGQDGSMPQAGLTVDKAGSLYGTTSSGGSNGQGTVFKLSRKGSGGYSLRCTASRGAATERIPWPG